MTYISLDVEVLEVEGMLPDVNADDRDMAEERILVSSGCDLQTLGGGVVPLKEDQLIEAAQRTGNRHTSHPQPEPWIPAVVVLN
jgi:hypothetical protein